VRSKFGGPAISDEELLLRVFAGIDEVRAMYAAGAPQAYLDARHPLVYLIDELTKRKDCSRIYIRKPDFVLTLEKRRGN
jgi:hypothetical protein